MLRLLLPGGFRGLLFSDYLTGKTKDKRKETLAILFPESFGFFSLPAQS